MVRGDGLGFDMNPFLTGDETGDREYFAGLFHEPRRIGRRFERDCPAKPVLKMKFAAVINPAAGDLIDCKTAEPFRQFGRKVPFRASRRGEIVCRSYWR